MKNSGVLAGRLPVIAALLLAAVAAYVLNCLTPAWVDDWFYNYMFVDGQFDLCRPVTSFADVFVSQYNHYFGYNGRLPVHIVVQAFDGVWGKGAFNVVNALLFALFAWLLACMTLKADAVNVLFVCGVLFLLFPEFGATVLWMSGSVNYLWTSIAVCLFLAVFGYLRTGPLRPKHMWLVLPSLLAGWTHEGLTFPLAVSLGLYALVNRRSICRQAVLPMIAGFALGALLCTFSPATLTRAAENASTLHLKILTAMKVFASLRALWVLLLTLVVIRIVKGEGAAFRDWFRDFYAENGILCNAVAVSFGVIFIAGMPSARVGICAELFSIIMWLRIVGSLKPRTANICKRACIVAGWMLCAVVIWLSAVNFREYRSVIAQLEDDSAEVVVFKNSSPSVLSGYVLNPVFGMFYDGVSHIDDFVSRQFGDRKKAFIPEMIYDDIMSGSDKIADIHRQGDYPLYVVPVEGDVEDMTPVLVLSPADLGSLPFYVRPFAPRLARYTLSEIAVDSALCDIVEVEGGRYLFVRKHESVDDRLKEIVFKR